MNVIIRRAKLEDYEGVLEIMNQVQNMHAVWRPDIYKNSDSMIEEDDFKEMVKEDTFYAAIVDDKVVGIMKLDKRIKESKSKIRRKILHISSMGVDEKYRGQGIGHMFFEETKRIKEKENFDVIELSVNAKNKAAYEMYSKIGFTESTIIMELL